MMAEGTSVVCAYRDAAWSRPGAGRGLLFGRTGLLGYRETES